MKEIYEEELQQKMVEIVRMYIEGGGARPYGHSEGGSVVGTGT